MQCLDYTDLYRTAPLHDPNTQIRLLRATQLEEKYLSYDFIVCDLSDAPPYDAISYTWGDPNERGFIRVNNVPISVTWNCRYALWQARQLGSIYTWIDAVCINQANLEEKGAQVAFMYSIYQSAAEVLACIGPPDDASERIYAALMEFDNEAGFDFDDRVESNNYKDGSPAMTWLAHKGDSFCEVLWQDYEQFSSRPYISRLWIVQELHAGGPGVNIIFGAIGSRWKLVIALFMTLEHLYFNRDTENSLAHVHELTQGLSRDFGSLCALSQNLLCFDVRDRVYGTLHLFDWQRAGITPLQPDYTKSPFELLVTMAPLILESARGSFWPLADLVQVFEIKASDPHLQPYLSCHGMCPVQSQHGYRQWEVPMDFQVQFDQVTKCCEKETRCVLQCGKSSKCSVSRGSTSSINRSRSTPNSHGKGLAHDSVCETIAEGWSDSAPGYSAQYIVPRSTEAGDVVVLFHFRRITSSLVIREESDQETITIIGKAEYLSSRSVSSKYAPYSSPSWRYAMVTMEATIEEMIGFLVPYDPAFVFKLPRIVAFRTLNGKPRLQRTQDGRTVRTISVRQEWDSKHLFSEQCR
ncbi:Heterokaryon incompatibility protein 6, OR allele [Pseudocercospora fuligena]|uniref:Heterokaryon incompatibility protein 6, OR allele n=1 Tax=Pseudocercospora fuligena TaxID=685502 RepID=A0A8H6RMW2_9PEZI|nr:Heterokaryon incompatibility protein 6, OR allele [Pseudocercospora fuligena]